MSNARRGTPPLRSPVRWLVALGLIGVAAVWLWNEPERDRARTVQHATAPPEEHATDVEADPHGSPGDTEDERHPLRNDVRDAPGLSLVEVVDPDGRPVADARVTAVDYSSHERVRRETGADGRASFDDLDADCVQVRKPGYALAEVGVSRTTERVVLQPALSVTGRAVVRGGGPAAAARIRIWDADDGYGNEIDIAQVADEDGRFTLTGIRPNHPFIVIATHRGYAPVVMTLAEPREFTVTFGDGFALAGDVVDANGAPVLAEVVVAPEGAVSPFNEVNIFLLREQRELASMARPTCEHGRFAVRGLEPGAYVVHARGPAGIGQTTVRVEHDGHVVVRLVRRATLVVNVVGPDGGEVERDYFAVHHDGDWEHDRGGETMQLDAGHYVVTANGDGFLGVREEIDLRPGETRTLTLKLREGVAVTGRLVDAGGAPIAGAQVEISQTVVGEYDWTQLSRSEAAGAWTLRGLAPGEGTLQVAARGFYEHREQVEVAPGREYVVKLETRGKLVGRLVPVPPEGRMGVDLDYANGSTSGDCGVAADGSFEVWDPDVDGPVTVTLTPEGKAPVVLRGFEFARGRVHDVGDLRLVENVTLRLTVLGHDGRPAKAALVEIREPAYVPGLRTDADGRLDVADQAPRVLLRIAADGHAVAYRTVDATHPVTVRLERGVAVSGRVLDPAGRPAAHAQLVFWARRDGGGPNDTVWWDTEAGADGRFALLLPPGPCRVVVYGDQRQNLPETFEATEGAHFELRMR